MSTIEKLFELAAEHARTVKNAVQISQEYAKQGFSQPGRNIPHIATFGFPQAPTPPPQYQGQGGALTSQDVNHFIDVRIHALKGAQENRASRNARVVKNRSNVTVPNNITPNPLDTREELAGIESSVDSQLYNSKLLEKANAFRLDIAKRAPTMPHLEAQALIDDTDATLLDVRDRATTETGKAAFVLQALVKILEDTRELLVIALSHDRSADKAKQVLELRGKHARKVSTAAAARRAAKAEAVALLRAEADQARDEAQHAYDDDARLAEDEDEVNSDEEAFAPQNVRSPARLRTRARNARARQALQDAVEEVEAVRIWPVLRTDAFYAKVAELATLDELREFGQHYGLPMRQRFIGTARAALNAI